MSLLSRILQWRPLPARTRALLILKIIEEQNGQAYGVTLQDEIHTRTGKSYSIGSIYEIITRLEGQNLITRKAFPGGPERGFRVKHCYSITAKGRGILMLDGLSKAQA